MSHAFYILSKTAPRIAAQIEGDSLAREFLAEKLRSPYFSAAVRQHEANLQLAAELRSLLDDLDAIGAEFWPYDYLIEGACYALILDGYLYSNVEPYSRRLTELVRGYTNVDKTVRVYRLDRRTKHKVEVFLLDE